MDFIRLDFQKEEINCEKSISSARQLLRYNSHQRCIPYRLKDNALKVLVISAQRNGKGMLYPKVIVVLLIDGMLGVVIPPQFLKHGLDFGALISIVGVGMLEYNGLVYHSRKIVDGSGAHIVVSWKLWYTDPL